MRFIALIGIVVATITACAPAEESESFLADDDSEAVDSPALEQSLDAAESSTGTSRLPLYSGMIYASMSADYSALVVGVTWRFADNSGCAVTFVDGVRIMRCPESTGVPQAAVVADIGRVRVQSRSGQLEALPHASDPYGNVYEEIVEPGIRLWSEPGEWVRTTYSLPNGRVATTMQQAPAANIAFRTTLPSALSRDVPLEVRWTGANRRDAGKVSVTLMGGLRANGIQAVTLTSEAAPQEGRVRFSKRVLALLPPGPAAASFDVESRKVDNYGVDHRLVARAAGSDMQNFTVE